MQLIEKEIRHFHMACGLGGGAKGFNKATARVGNLVAKFRCIGGVDVDAAACRDFERIVGVKAACLDLFDRSQYRAFHGHEPPADWRETGIDDIHRAAGFERPHIVFASYPCKGFSGLLSEKMSTTAKYQALNRLTLRGMMLVLEAWKDDPVELIVFENVPRIATRGRWLLDQIVALFHHYDYAVAETTHDCGEIGNLAQSRKRFLMVARYRPKVPNYLYEPSKHRLRGVGQVLDKLPVPGMVPGLGGPMHRMPQLQWKTWVRLAFVRAGADWRSLNELRVDDGKLLDFGIMPDYGYRGLLGVTPWDQPAATVSSRGLPTNGSFAVADPREVHGHDFHGLRVNDWLQTAAAVTTQRSPGSSAQSVADPRVEGHAKSVQLGVRSWDQPAGVVTGKMFVGGGPNAVADPRLDGERFNHAYRIVAWDQAAPSISSARGALAAVADPRTNNRPGAHESKFAVQRWDAPAKTVTGSDRVGSGALCVSDPRVDRQARRTTLGVTDWREPAGSVRGESLPSNGTFAVADPRSTNEYSGKGKYRITGYQEPAGTVIGASTTGQGAFAVADPRPSALSHPERAAYVTGGHYGVVPWEQPSGAVPAYAKNNNGPWSVADPRVSANGHDAQPIALPAANEKLVCIIRALDGTWHRPFTTLELAALQSLIDPEEYLELDGLSDSAWRERIGNMVPPDAAMEMGGCLGRCLLGAWSGQTFMLSSEPIWVQPIVIGLMAGR